MKIESLIEEGNPIVDVRTPAEFAGGSVPNAVNIPLNEIVGRVDEFTAMKQPVVLCCASGNRSGQACSFLSEKGIDCINGGSWLDVNAAVAEVI